MTFENNSKLMILVFLIALLVLLYKAILFKRQKRGSSYEYIIVNICVFEGYFLF
jgi:hypothetical protein